MQGSMTSGEMKSQTVVVCSGWLDLKKPMGLKAAMENWIPQSYHTLSINVFRLFHGRHENSHIETTMYSHCGVFPSLLHFAGTRR